MPGGRTPFQGGGRIALVNGGRLHEFGQEDQSGVANIPKPGGGAGRVIITNGGRLTEFTSPGDPTPPVPPVVPIVVTAKGTLFGAAGVPNPIAASYTFDAKTHIIVVAGSYNKGPTGVTWTGAGGGPLTKDKGINIAWPCTLEVSIWSLYTAAGGLGNLQATFSDTSHSRWVAISQVSGLATSSYVDATGSLSSSGTNLATAATATSANKMLAWCGYMFKDNSGLPQSPTIGTYGGDTPNAGQYNSPGWGGHYIGGEGYGEIAKSGAIIGTAIASTTGNWLTAMVLYKGV